jgi:Rad3-related DNA helicase
MTEGLDLKDHLGRFQIITKVPYPYMGDKVVQARMKKNPGWYAYKTLLTLIQAYGRATRSETDSSVTYILDGAFDRLISGSKKVLPKWFVEAII